MNVIEALVVTLGLDASAYKKAAADTRADQGKVVEQSDKMAKRLESDGKRAAQSFRSVRNEVAGLLLAFTGAASIGTFAKSILTNDAAVGRLATNLGVATGELSKWEAMVQRVGGQAGDADSTFRSLKAIFNDVRLTGNMSSYGDLAGLGITDINQLKNPDEALLTMAGTGERMDRSEFAARLGRLGISDSMITLLGKGRAGVQAYLVEQEKLGHATDESSRAAQRYEDAIARLESLLREKIRPLITDAIEWFEKWAGDTNNLSIAASALLVVLGGLSLWVIAAAAPWIAFAAAIALVLTNLDRLKGIAAALLAGDFKGAWNVLTSGDTFGTPDVSRASPNWIANVNKSLPAAGGGGAPNAGIIAYLKRAGFSNEQARGIDAGIGAEGGHAGALNRKSGAFGIGQWLGARKRGLFAKYGPNPSHDQQMAYLVWELNGGDHGGAAVRGQNTAEGTLNAYIRNFMRPAAGAETTGDLSRGMGILGGRPPVGTMARVGGGGSSSTTMSVGEVKIYTAATDAQGIARDLPGALAQRGLVVQSARGMNP